MQASNYTTASTAIAVVPFPFAVVPSYFLPHRRHSSAVMPFSLAVVCPSAVISHPRIIPDLDPLVVTNTTNLFRSIDKISSNCKCLGAPPWRSKFAGGALPNLLEMLWYPPFNKALDGNFCCAPFNF